jgi:hypothetical protein
LSTRLERYVWMTIAVVALSVAILAMLPDVAAAQEEDTSGAPPRQVEQNADESTYESTDSAAGLRVVTPGDSLWSIAQEQLGPNAAPEWVANEVGRIYWLNHDRIGEDPNLILVGQELTLLPATSEPVPVETVPVEPERVESVTSEASEEPAAAEVPSEAPSEASTEPGVLPELPEADAELVSASGQGASATPERDGDTRRKAGYAVLLFTFAVALLGTAVLLSKRHRAYR